jgi:hypothetical protein
MIEAQIMKIKITSNKTIEDIQSEFNKEFPFLKIQFFKHTHKEFQGSAKRELIPIHTNIGLLKHHNGQIEITADMTVSELEQLFKDKLGLNVQVFRKSGKSWLETTVTDSWTLKKQDDEGKELSTLEN